MTKFGKFESQRNLWKPKSVGKTDEGQKVPPGLITRSFSPVLAPGLTLCTYLLAVVENFLVALQTELVVVALPAILGEIHGRLAANERYFCWHRRGTDHFGSINQLNAREEWCVSKAWLSTLKAQHSAIYSPQQLRMPTARL